MNDRVPVPPPLHQSPPDSPANLWALIAIMIFFGEALLFLKLDVDIRHALAVVDRAEKVLADPQLDWALSMLEKQEREKP